MIDEYFKKGHHFAYIRRLKEEMLATYVIDYFADMFGEEGYIYKATKGKYNCVDVFRRKIYFAYNDGETITRGEQFGNMFCLLMRNKFNMPRGISIRPRLQAY